MGELKENIKNEPDSTEKTEIDKPTNIFDAAMKGIVKAVDQNSDGALDIKDVAVIADNIGSAAAKAAGAVKGTGDQIGNFLSKAKRDLDLKTLRPIFADDIHSTKFYMPELVRITNMDKRHSINEVCKGSVAHMETHGGIELINIYKNHIDSFTLELTPDASYEIYYKDPCVHNHYIALDEYFHFLKEARVNELKGIAQDLGAKYFKISYKEDKKSANVQKVNAGAAQKVGVAKAEESVNYSTLSNRSVSINIIAERHCMGHDPIKPNVVYFKNDPTVQELISSRLEKKNTTTRDKFRIECRKSSGIKINDAKKIDLALKAIKCSLSINIVKETQSEERRILEYEIEF